ncbi:hypothetical protein DDR33_03285 [Pararcticibacter amylolyticus]|uniref:Uncharacterized protein n=1 Tax=Pararcticibacter amylolyticus TaxID=2173175 RepID=A0A2U2PKW6_9SPHI|nr:hypothetical protein DDR33_03285 [Pararcticibacter amylolyticus]
MERLQSIKQQYEALLVKIEALIEEEANKLPQGLIVEICQTYVPGFAKGKYFNFAMHINLGEIDQDVLQEIEKERASRRADPASNYPDQKQLPHRIQTDAGIYQRRTDS